MSKKLGEMVAKECRSEEFRDCELIFPGLDSDVAGEIGTSPVFTTISIYLKLLSTELEFSQANLAVFSNAKNYRRDPLVPLVVPTFNVSHLNLIPHQRKQRSLGK